MQDKKEFNKLNLLKVQNFTRKNRENCKKEWIYIYKLCFYAGQNSNIMENRFAAIKHSAVKTLNYIKKTNQWDAVLKGGLLNNHRISP